MPGTTLLIGTRKGAFFLESKDRKTWELNGPFCEGWPVYHMIHDPKSDAVYAAAASEWHGAGVWRSEDRGDSFVPANTGLPLKPVIKLAISPGFASDGTLFGTVTLLAATISGPVPAWDTEVTATSSS